MSKITHLFEAIEQVALSESVEQYHHDQAHAHNAMAKDCHDKALNHTVARDTAHDNQTGTNAEFQLHDSLAQAYKKAAESHAKLAAFHGASHDKLKNSIKQ